MSDPPAGGRETGRTGGVAGAGRATSPGTRGSGAGHRDRDVTPAHGERAAARPPGIRPVGT